MHLGTATTAEENHRVGLIAFCVVEEETDQRQNSLARK